MDTRRISLIHKAIILLAIFSVFFSGCRSTIAEQPVPTASHEVKPDKEIEPVTVKFMVHEYSAIFEQLAKEFNSLNPDIKIELLVVESSIYDQVKAQKLSAGAVDVVLNFQTNPMQTEWAKGSIKFQFLQEMEFNYYADLTNMPSLKNWKQTALEESSMFQGKVYAVPFALSALNVVFYNKKIFRDNNLKVPETWSEFVDVCNTLKNNKVTPIIVGGKESWPLLMISNAFVAACEPDMPAYAKQLWTGERKYNDEKSLKIWDMAADFLSFLPTDYDKTEYGLVVEKFAKDEAAMLVDGSWQAGNIKNYNPQMEFGCFTMPGYEKGDDPIQISGKYDILISVSEKSPNRDAALKWLEFLCEKETYKKFVEMAQVIPLADIDVDNEFISSLSPYLKNPTSAWEHIMPVHARVNLARFSSYVRYRSAIDHYTNIKQLADEVQKEWDGILGNTNKAQ